MCRGNMVQIWKLTKKLRNEGNIFREIAPIVGKLRPNGSKCFETANG